MKNEFLAKQIENTIKFQTELLENAKAKGLSTDYLEENIKVIEQKMAECQKEGLL